MGDVLEADADEFLFGAPEDRADHRVDLDQAPVGGGDGLADGAVLEGASEARLALEEGRSLLDFLRAVVGDAEYALVRLRPLGRPVHRHRRAVAADVAVLKAVDRRPAHDGLGSGHRLGVVVGVHEVHVGVSFELVGRVAPDRAGRLAHAHEAAVGVDRADDVEREAHEQPHLLAGLHALGGIDAVDEDAVDGAVGLWKGLVDEVDEPFIRGCAGGALQGDAHLVGAERLAGGVDAVEDLEEPLRLQFGKGLPHRPPQQSPVSDERLIGCVSVLVDEGRAAQDRDERRSEVEGRRGGRHKQGTAAPCGVRGLGRSGCRWPQRRVGLSALASVSTRPKFRCRAHGIGGVDVWRPAQDGRSGGTHSSGRSPATGRQPAADTMMHPAKRVRRARCLPFGLHLSHPTPRSSGPSPSHGASAGPRSISAEHRPPSAHVSNT